MITITPSAATKIQGIMGEQGEQTSALRIIVTGMGCSGPQYMMTLDNDQQEDDSLLEMQGIRVLVDQDTASVLEGAEIDYLEGLERSGFAIVNPNYQGEGGCGSGCSCGSGH